MPRHVAEARARVGVGGATPKATRFRSVESILEGTDLSEQVLEEASKLLSRDLGQDLLADHYASADYRRAMAGVFLNRAIRAALD